MNPLARFLALLLAVAGSAGCVIRSQVRNAPYDAGVRHSYAATFDTVRTAAQESLVEADFSPREEGWMDTDQWRILSSQGLTSGTVGRVARVVVENHPTDCRVWVIVQSKLDNADTRAADAGITRDLFARMGRRLGSEPPRPAPVSVSAAADAERVYAAPLTACSEAARKVLQDRGYENARRDRAGEVLETLTASAKDGRRLFVALYPHGSDRTRIVVDPSSPSEAREFHAALVLALE